MPRPARGLWVTRAYARRRHQSWHLSMTLATLGWGTWWLCLLARRLVPSWEVPLAIPAVISTVFALLGFVIAVLTLRAQRSWILFTLVPLFANSTLLAVPWLAREIVDTDS